MNRIETMLVVLLLSLFGLASCSHAEKRFGKTTPKENREREGVYSNQLSEKVEPETIEMLAYLIRQKNYSTALSSVERGIDGGKKEVTFEDEYVDAINRMIDEGRKKLKGEDYESSGRIFSTVIDMYPDKKVLGSKVKEKPEKLKEHINLSSEKLMDAGLAEYRDGNLGNAIKTWRKILRFNPRYDEAKKAIETATVQLKNLRILKEKDREKSSD